MELESLDARGLLCPLPVIRTQDRVRNLQPGTLLTVIATDPATLQDIPAWCRVHGHELLDAETLEAEKLAEEWPDNRAKQVADGKTTQPDRLGPGGGLVFCFRIRVMDS